MKDLGSPIIDFYPTDFRVDQEGKRNDWEGIVLVRNTTVMPETLLRRETRNEIQCSLSAHGSRKDSRRHGDVRAAAGSMHQARLLTETLKFHLMFIPCRSFKIPYSTSLSGALCGRGAAAGGGTVCGAGTAYPRGA